jgi:hypothetical protein
MTDWSCFIKLEFHSVKLGSYISSSQSLVYLADALFDPTLANEAFFYQFVHFYILI